MRDYSFGNFLHELRVRRGLSQYQLGMLVGVSNKAVSKWENGSARPRSRILHRLSEVLGVTADEFLACKYHPMENKSRKGVFAMKKTLWENAGEKLAAQYGVISEGVPGIVPGDMAGAVSGNTLQDVPGTLPPVELADRYFSEYAELKNTDQILYFDFLSRLSGEAGRIGGHMHINGGIGASFAAFVMGATGINPIRPHYYCPVCHKMQFADGALCGWDLPARKCACGRELARDGHSLPFETLRPVISQPARYNISVSQNLYRAADEMIPACFQGNKVVTLTKEKPGTRMYVILDAGFAGPADGQELSYEENYDRFKHCPSITLVWNKEMDAWGKLEEETGIPFEKVPFMDQEILAAFLSGDTQGIPEFRTDFFKVVTAEARPASIHGLIQILGLGHGTGTWEGNGQELIRAGHPIEELMAHRDDVFRYIQGRMKPAGGCGTGFAWQVMEDVRRGVYAGKGMPAGIRRQLLELGAEEWVLESFGRIRYLFPEANSILRVKHAMILMWYKIHCPDAFARIILA